MSNRVNVFLSFLFVVTVVVVLAGAAIGGAAANGDEPAFTDAAFANGVMATWGASNAFCGLAVPDGNLVDASGCLRMFHVNNCVFLVQAYVETYGWTQDVARPYVSRCLAPLQIVIDAVDSGSVDLPIS